jgi:hypothetical protein
VVSTVYKNLGLKVKNTVLVRTHELSRKVLRLMLTLPLQLMSSLGPTRLERLHTMYSMLNFEAVPSMTKT